MNEQDQEQEDFGTKKCNRCGVIFKRKNRYNFFCPKCADHNKRQSPTKVGHLPARAGHGPTVS